MNVANATTTLTIIANTNISQPASFPFAIPKLKEHIAITIIPTIKRNGISPSDVEVS